MASTINAALTNGLIQTADTSGILQLQTAGTTALTIDGSQNIGIGVTSPVAKLGITAAGDATFGSQVIISPAAGANPAKIAFNPSISSGIAGLSNGSLAFYGNGANTERMRIDSAGNVLVGATVTNTNGVLQVNGGIGIAPNSTVRQWTNSDGGTLKFYGTQFVVGQTNSQSYGYTGGAGLASVSPSAGYITLDVGGQTTGTGHRLKVINDGTGITGYLYYGLEGGSTPTLYANTVSGNVGIGTNSPGIKLDVVGTMRANTSVVAGNSSFGITINQNTLTLAGANSIFTFTKPVPTISNSSRFDFNTGSLNTGIQAGPWWNGVHFNAQDVITNASAANEFPRTSHYYSYSTVTNPTDLNYNIVTGNSTVPQHMTIGTATSANIKFLIANAEAMRIDYNNNVGIGTTSPITRLHVAGGGGSQSWAWFNQNTAGGTPSASMTTGLALGGNYSAGGTEGNIVYGTYLTIAKWDGTTYSERMRIDSSGNVGIGIGALSFSTQVTPSLTMYGGNTGLCLRNATTGTGNNVGTDIFLGTGGDLNIDQRSAQPIYFQTTATTRMAITASGDVGINTTTPSKKFEVYTAANSLQIGAIVRNDQAGTGVAAIGFNVSAAAGSDASVTKAGIGLVRQFTYGRGTLTFYNDNSAANTDFTTANAVMSIDAGGTAYVGGTSTQTGATGTIYSRTTARAYANFGANTSATVVRDSFNCSSITYSAAGKFAVAFSSALVDANYTCKGSCASDGQGFFAGTSFHSLQSVVVPPTSSGFTMFTSVSGVNGGFNPTYVFFTVYR